jgi:arsenite methyltransferase
MTMLQFDDEAAREVESVYTTPDVVRQREIVLDRLAVSPGERVLDIGVGPGFLARGLSAAAGPDGFVGGIDISDSMLVLAGRRSSVPDGAPIELRTGSAVSIPYEDDAFDAAVSTQVLEYVSDLPAAIAEITRVLRPGGRVLILDTDWDSLVWHSTEPELMKRVIEVWGQHLADPHLPRRLGGLLRAAGFSVSVREVVPIFSVGSNPDTFGRGLIDVVARFVAGRDGLTDDDVQAWRTGLVELGEDYFFSLNRYLFVATAPR